MKNHDVEPVTNAFTQGLPIFDVKFMQNVKEILADDEIDSSFSPHSLVAQIVFVATKVPYLSKEEAENLATELKAYLET